MDILIITPTAFPHISGNAATAERWRRGLVRLGHTVDVLESKGLSVEGLSKEIERIQPDIIHAHHAYKSGELLLGIHDVPWVVSPSGTDLSENLDDLVSRKVVTTILLGAKNIITQSVDAMQRVAALSPQLRECTTHVQKSVFWFGSEVCDLRKLGGWGEEEFVFFIPAGVRPVKGNLECLDMLAEVNRQRPKVRALFTGHAVDEEYSEDFSEVIHKNSFASWLPPIPFGAMGSAYKSSNVVVNSSFSEGKSNALLEAAAVGTPVLATDIAPNRSTIVEGGGKDPSGLLYAVGDRADFIEKALSLVDQPDYLATLADAAIERARGWPTLEDEARELLGVYSASMEKKGLSKKGLAVGDFTPF